MNKITKLIIRLLKENMLYNSYINNYEFVKVFNNITIPWASYNFRSVYHFCDWEVIYNLLCDVFDVDGYKNYINFKTITIYNIKNVEKLFSYFNKNGIIWGGGKKCTMDYFPKEFKPYEKGSYLKLYNDDCRIYYGSGYSPILSTSSIDLTEDEFYIYYENYKKKINDNFERFLKKKINYMNKEKHILINN